MADCGEPEDSAMAAGCAGADEEGRLDQIRAARRVSESVGRSYEDRVEASLLEGRTDSSKTLSLSPS